MLLVLRVIVIIIIFCLLVGNGNWQDSERKKKNDNKIAAVSLSVSPILHPDSPLSTCYIKMLLTNSIFYFLTQLNSSN